MASGLNHIADGRRMKVVLATNNRGKVAEFQHLFENTNIDIVPQSDFHVSEVEETGSTFRENALLKAKNATEATGLPAIADDSGLEVDALNGAPGVYSARFAGEGATPDEHIDKLLRTLGDLEMAKRTARFRCVLVYMRNAADTSPIVCEGVWEGAILFERRGKNGFGYDPIFFVPTDHCSAAELSPARKIALSHRGQAMRQLLNYIHKIE